MNGANLTNGGLNNGNLNGNGLNMRPTHMNAPGNMQAGAPQNTMIYNTNNAYPPRPNFTPGMVNHPAAMANANAAAAAAKKATAANKRTAAAAGMDDGDRKAPKKKAAPNMPQPMGMGIPGRGVPGQMGNPGIGGAMGQQAGGVNRPLNTPGAFYPGQGGNSTSSAGAAAGMRLLYHRTYRCQLLLLMCGTR
jgi:hypothetical protein